MEEIPPTLAATETDIAAAMLRPQVLPKMPWEMNLDERRKVSCDPRIVKQVAQEAQWDNTVCSGIWQRVRQFALPKNDWMLNKEQFTQLLLANGAKGAHFCEKIFQVYDSLHNTGLINGLYVCKILHLALTTPPHNALFIRHCFERFDKPLQSTAIPVEDLMNCMLLRDDEIVKSKGKKSKKGGGGGGSGAMGERGKKPEAMVCGARYEMVEGLKQIVQQEIDKINHPPQSTLLPHIAIGSPLFGQTQNPSFFASQSTLGGALVNSMNNSLPNLPHHHSSSSLTPSSSPQKQAAAPGSSSTGSNPAASIVAVPLPNAAAGGSGSPSSALPPLVGNPMATQLPAAISFDDFARFMSDGANGAWIGNFFTALMECSAKYFSPPNGMLPLLPLRWVTAMEPLPAVGEMYDADIWLLRDMEANYDPNAKKRGKKGKGGGGGKKKKK